MIVYNLRCECGHEFEGWFASSKAFDSQVGTQKLACPLCESYKVEKSIMAPAIAGTKKAAQAPEQTGNLRQYMAGIRKYVEENADYVGKDFPEEARKIHYGEATNTEVQDLVEQGVAIVPLPPDLDSTN